MHTNKKAIFAFYLKSVPDGQRFMQQKYSDDNVRERRIYRVTLMGSLVNVVLLVFKLVAGIVGHSSALIADAVHSLSDFLTDLVVIVFVRISRKPVDKDHKYGHGKYETLATAIIGVALLGVGIALCYDGIYKIYRCICGYQLPRPGFIAFAAAVVSILLKEWAYRFTVKTGRETGSQAVVANAWHHRSDALSSIGTAVGVGGALFLGTKWTVLDPIAAVVVSIVIIVTAFKLLNQAIGELTECSLPDDLEKEITEIAGSEPDVSSIHNLRTRRIGNTIAISMHLRLPGDISLYHAHEHASNIEKNLRSRFGRDTFIGLHLEPTKVDGRYVEPTGNSANSKR